MWPSCFRRCAQHGESQGARPQTRKPPLKALQLRSGEPQKKGIESAPARHAKVAHHIECHRRAPPLDRPLGCRVLHSLPEESMRLLPFFAFGRRHTKTKTSSAGSSDHPDKSDYAVPLRLPRSVPSCRRGLKHFPSRGRHAARRDGCPARMSGWAGRDHEINPPVLVVVQGKKFRMSSKAANQILKREHVSSSLAATTPDNCSGTNGPCSDRHLDPCKRRGLDRTEQVVPSPECLLEIGTLQTP
jgi:hypothetical protein